jgi:hypothetical protein
MCLLTQICCVSLLKCDVMYSIVSILFPTWNMEDIRLNSRFRSAAYESAIHGVLQMLILKSKV